MWSYDKMVGVSGLEPLTSWPPSRRATKLRHTPTLFRGYYTASEALLSSNGTNSTEKKALHTGMQTQTSQ